MWKAISALPLAQLVILFFLANSGRLHACEVAILNVLLNTQDRGDHIVVITESRDALLTSEVLHSLGLAILPNMIEVEFDGQQYVSLKSLAPRINFDIDTSNATLTITADPALLGTSVFDLDYGRSTQIAYSQHNSGFLNYSFLYDLTNDSKFDSLSIPTEAGFSIDGRLLFSSFSYFRADDEEKFVRLITNFTVDNAQRKRQLVIGDFSAFSGELGGGGIFGGLSIAKKFSMTPRFIRSPELNLSGFVETPSELQIYVNNRLIETRRIPPGAFEFLNIPNNRGAGEVTLVIRDAFGRERLYEYPFYLSTDLLKAGLQEYSYNVGFHRRNFGTNNFDYGELAFLGFHRVGITDNFTFGIGGEASGRMKNVSAEFAFASSTLGELAISAAGSLEGHSSGLAASLRYVYRGSHFSRRLSIKGFSKDYSTLTLSPESTRPRFVGTIGLGYSPLASGAVSILLATQDYYTGPAMKRMSVSYTKRVFNYVSLFVALSRTEVLDASNEIFIGFTAPIGSGRSAGINYLGMESAHKVTTYLSKNAPSNVGYGYQIQADVSESPVAGDAVNGSAMLEYRGSRGVLFGGYRYVDSRNHYRVGFSGSAAFIGRSFHLSRPISDSFALVKVGDIEGVSVRQSNREVGVTDKNGEVFVPDLVSYLDNHVSFDDRGLPVNYAFSSTEQHTVTPLRGGAIVLFEVDKLQAFVGHLYIVEKGEKTLAEYWGLELGLPDGSKQFIVGKNAEFYLENVPAGEWPARLFFGHMQCSFAMAIPNSDEMVVDMGAVECEIQ